MSTNTFKIGDKVKLIALPDETGRLELGDKLRVTAIDESDPVLDVRVEREDGYDWWLNRAHLKLRGKKRLKVGDKVIVKVQTNPRFFPVGTEGVVTDIDCVPPHSYKVEALGDYWYYHREQLKRVKVTRPTEAPTEAPKRDIQRELQEAWPWPAGTPVRFSASGGFAHCRDQTGCKLGSDGSMMPPVLGSRGVLVRYVEMSDVELGTEYRTWSHNHSRTLSDRSEEERTGPLDLKGSTLATIRHRGVRSDEVSAFNYRPGDFRDNGDGTGTVLTLEEIFLNGLKK